MESIAGVHNQFMTPARHDRGRRPENSTKPVLFRRLSSDGRGPGVARRAPFTYQPACKPGSVWRQDSLVRQAWRVTAIPLERRLPGASSNQPGRPDSDIDPGTTPPLARRRVPRRPYSVLLPVGFALPSALPQARCALTAPFHPCRSPLPSLPRSRGRVREGAPRRSVLCGTVPGVTPAGRYPAPHVHGARTFLPGTPSLPSARAKGREGVPGRPSGRLTD
jgi:hypothetical protein